MISFRKWIRDKTTRSKQRQGQQKQPYEPPALPYLPVPRPRSLISPPPDFDLRLSVQNYGRFAALPYELRRQILVEVFGGARVHMDLSYHSEQQQWLWSGGTCHRRAEYSEVEQRERYDAGQLAMSIEPCDDECLGEPDRMRSVGVMAWLLACRQAYIDGIDVLYNTNTFHLSSLDLQLHLPRLVPDHHLARITSLELLWDLNKSRGKGVRQLPVADHVKALWEGRQPQEGNPLHIFCDMILGMLPQLRYLYISFQCWLNPPPSSESNDVISELETIFLGPLEKMLMRMRSRGQKLELNVAIQRCAWYILLRKYHTLLGNNIRVESIDEICRGRFWKPLADAGDGDGDGYWICGGWEDMKGFGTEYWMTWGNAWTPVWDTF